MIIRFLWMLNYNEVYMNPIYHCKLMTILSKLKEKIHMKCANKNKANRQDNSRFKYFVY